MSKALRFFTIEQLGPKMYRAPDGLVIYDTPIARTGIQLYHFSEIVNNGETPFAGNSDGIVKIHRDADEVFRAETIRSFNGATLVNDHPDENVNPDNWKDVAVGVVMNPHRGTGDEDNYLMADIKITDAAAIEDVLAGKRELSCGYDAEYIRISPEEGRQVNIIGNHVAIVAKGRCGSTCRISDSLVCATADSEQGVGKMKKWLDSLKAAFSSKDEAKIGELLASAPVSATTDDEATGAHIHIHQGSAAAASGDHKWGDEAIGKKFEEYDKRFGDHEKLMTDNHKAVMDALEELKKGKEEQTADEKEIEGKLEEEAPSGTGDKARTAKDSAFLVDAYRNTVAVAEIIAPGLHYPVFDSGKDPHKTYRDICSLRRKALTVGNSDSVTNGIIESVIGRTLTADGLEKMSCGDVRTLFHAVGTIKKEKNNAAAAKDTHKETEMVKVGGPRTVADWNKANHEFYAKQ